MQTITEQALERANRGLFTRYQVACWMNNSGARLDALLKRAVAKDEIWRICRGLYCLSNRYMHQPVNPLELAQRIHGPSYISLETALSFHGWIPEAVHAITSVSLERSRTFDTPFGLFSYTRIPQLSLFSGVTRQTEEAGGSFFMATPLKALADYVYTHQCDWTTAVPVVESLRVDETALAELTTEMFDDVLPAYKPGRVRRFLIGFRKALKL